MREATSGLLFTKNRDGSIRVEAVDYGVAEFGGGEWESWYDLTKENAALLYAALKKLHRGTFRQKLIKQFGESFNMPQFEAFCKEHGITYEHMTWSSF